MNTVLRMKRIAPLALAVLAAGGLLAGCSHDNGNADTGDNMAATTPAAPATSAGMPADTSAMADANGMPPGTTADNASTMAGATPGTAATTADASAMAGDMSSGPITASHFYQEALNGGQKEIDASKLAEKSSNAQVKALAKTIIADHTALGEKVKAAAGANPPTPASPDLSSLTGKTGADLDKAYVDMMVSDHQKDIPMFENASKNADTDQAKQLATAALPKLKKHLDMAQKVQSSLK